MDFGLRYSRKQVALLEVAKSEVLLEREREKEKEREDEREEKERGDEKEIPETGESKVEEEMNTVINTSTITTSTDTTSTDTDTDSLPPPPQGLTARQRQRSKSGYRPPTPFTPETSLEMNFNPIHYSYRDTQGNLHGNLNRSSSSSSSSSSGPNSSNANSNANRDTGNRAKNIDNRGIGNRSSNSFFSNRTRSDADDIFSAVDELFPSVAEEVVTGEYIDQLICKVYATMLVCVNCVFYRMQQHYHLFYFILFYFILSKLT